MFIHFLHLTHSRQLLLLHFSAVLAVKRTYVGTFAVYNTVMLQLQLSPLNSCQWLHYRILWLLRLSFVVCFFANKFSTYTFCTFLALLFCVLFIHMLICVVIYCSTVQLLSCHEVNARICLSSKAKEAISLPIFFLSLKHNTKQPTFLIYP